MSAMQFSHPRADVFLPSGGGAPEDILAKVTHLCVAAHQDDIEIMAQAGISDCLAAPEKRFGNGAGAPRMGPYSGISDEQPQEIRWNE